MRDNDAAAVALICVGVVAFVVWKFSTTFGLDINTGFSVLLRLVGFAILFAGCWWFVENGLFSIGQLWPIILAFFWACWWPALDYWASDAIPAFASYGVSQTTLWWNTVYTKFGVFFGLIAFGYAANRFFDD